MEQWSEGIYLLGRYGSLNTGCWLFIHQSEAAVLEMPPCSRKQRSPVPAIRDAVEEMGIEIRYLLCTHCHGDHISNTTLAALQRAFPASRTVLQRGFSSYMPSGLSITYFDDQRKLTLDGEPLFLIHAPKHSWTDTVIVFRGAACMGDWELNTLRSVHDGRGKDSVPEKRKLISIRTLHAFPLQQHYVIHKVFAVHANDYREKIDFHALMEDTSVDRALW